MEISVLNSFWASVFGKLCSLRAVARVRCGSIVVPNVSRAWAGTESACARHCFRAHPDDCDLGAGASPPSMAALGNKVKFVSLTNGDAGHQLQHGEELAKRRRAEAEMQDGGSASKYEVLDNHDGKLLPTLEVREQVIREIASGKLTLSLHPARMTIIRIIATLGSWCRTRHTW